MKHLYKLSARLCGSLAFLCAILALSTLPSAFADPGQVLTCEQCCEGGGYTGEQYQQCVSSCLQGIGECGLQVKILSSCPTAPAAPCTFRSKTSQAQCNGGSCVEPGKGICICVWIPGPQDCECPR